MDIRNLKITIKIDDQNRWILLILEFYYGFESLKVKVKKVAKSWILLFKSGF